MKPTKLLSQIWGSGASEERDDYFMVVLRRIFVLMILYYFIYMIICCMGGQYTHAVLTLLWIAFMAIGLHSTFRSSEKRMFQTYTVLMIVWSILSVYNFGWNVGGQHFLLPTIVILFFCVHYSGATKMIMAAFILFLRLALFFYCQKYKARVDLGRLPSLILQIVNSITLFAGMIITCQCFSSKVQGAEKRLRIANEKLKAQASTDLLTNLPNRRYMLDYMQAWRNENPMERFSVAIADIDFFKTINDTWGHECGDEVLRTLAALFSDKMKNIGRVCRWGGEEFLFFLPHMHVDEAKFEIDGLNMAVRRLCIPYEEQNIRLTMTFGLEENDFKSELKDLIRKADEKLYYGKEHGRNCVIG